MTKKLSRQHLVEHRRKRGSDELENSEKETETAKRSIIFFFEIQRLKYLFQFQSTPKIA